MKTPHTYALCRCGQSKTKPFCDGTHTKVGFDGAETASREPYARQAKTFDGPLMTLTDAEQLCAFERFCDPNGQVWNQVAGTNDPEVQATFIRQVANCPAGRLVAWYKASQTPIEPELPVSIGLIEDPVEECSGPLWLRGGVTVVAADGFEYEKRNRVTLCRCGQSETNLFATAGTRRSNSADDGRHRIYPRDTFRFLRLRLTRHLSPPGMPVRPSDRKPPAILDRHDAETKAKRRSDKDRCSRRQVQHLRLSNGYRRQSIEPASRAYPPLFKCRRFYDPSGPLDHFRPLSPYRASISGGASRSVAVLAIEAASALGPNTSVAFALGGSKPAEMGLGLCRCRVWPMTATILSTRQIAGADRVVLKRRLVRR